MPRDQLLEPRLEVGTELRNVLDCQLQDSFAQRSRRRRLALSAAIVIAAVAGTVVPLVTGAVDGAWPVTLLIVGGASVGCGALVPHFGHRRIWGAIVTIGVVLGIVVAVHELIGGSNHPAKNPVTTSAKNTP